MINSTFVGGAPRADFLYLKALLELTFAARRRSHNSFYSDITPLLCVLSMPPGYCGENAFKESGSFFTPFIGKIVPVPDIPTKKGKHDQMSNSDGDP